MFQQRYETIEAEHWECRDKDSDAKQLMLNQTMTSNRCVTIRFFGFFQERRFSREVLHHSLHSPMSASASPAKLSTVSHTEKLRCTLLCYLRTLNYCGSLTVNGSAEEKEAPMERAKDQLLQFWLKHFQTLIQSAGMCWKSSISISNDLAHLSLRTSKNTHGEGSPSDGGGQKTNFCSLDQNTAKLWYNLQTCAGSLPFQFLTIWPIGCWERTKIRMGRAPHHFFFCTHSFLECLIKEFV